MYRKVNCYAFKISKMIQTETDQNIEFQNARNLCFVEENVKFSSEMKNTFIYEYLFDLILF